MKFLSMFIGHLFVSLVGLTCLANNPSILPESVKEAFTQGNASEILVHCCDKVDISLPENNVECGKNKSLALLKTFFEKNPPRLFDIVFEGGQNNSKYAVGKLTTNNGEFRINIFMKDNIIIQLSIENYDEN